MKLIKHGMMAAILTLCGSMALTSCIKDERANSECDILGAWVEGDAYKQYFTDDFKTVEQALYPVYGTVGVFYRIKLREKHR